MINCDADIDWGSNKEEIFDNKDDNDEESDDDDSELERDDEQDSDADEEMEFNFNHPTRVSLCASLIVNYLHLLLISFLVLVTKVTLICPSTREID